MDRGNIFTFRGITPTVAADAFIAPGAQVIGDVVIGAGSSVWFNCVLRGDVCHIRVGARSNLQDGTVVHVTTSRFPTIVGDDVLVGHKVMLHGCELQDRSFIGMSAVIMDQCVVETGAMIAAGAFLPPGKIARKGELWAGWPASPVRALTEKEERMIENGASHYAELAAEYRALQG
ncbi:MAG: gamma carbonic anhydrase family protein [Pseudomonadota bacterium]|nr:gamma carbonic anhydrase family protein [Pseudomonadota bacterium]